MHINITITHRYIFAVSLVIMFLCFLASSSAVIAGTPVSGQNPSAVSPDKVIAYYFHRNVRCATCRKIETYSHEAIEQGFAGALKAGKLEWRLVNIEEEPNEHFTADFQLYTSSLVLVGMKNGKQSNWKNLDQVWTLNGDKEAFTKYVQSEVGNFMGGK